MRDKLVSLNLAAVVGMTVGLVLFASGISKASTRLSRANAEKLMTQADQFYQAKNYENAIDTYQEIIKSGFEGTSLYYNLGDAYYRDGRLGLAILYYEKALRLSPGDEDVIHNLKIANSRTVDKIDALPQFFLFQWWESLLALLSVTGWTYTAYFFYLLLLASIALYFFAKSPGVQRFSVYSGFVTVMLLIATASLLSVKVNRELNVRSAIVIEQTAAVKLSPDPTSNDAFVIHEGLKVRELNSVGDWVLIRIQDGKEGWIQQSDIATI